MDTVSSHSERTALLVRRQSRNFKCSGREACLNSKAALLVLLSSFAMFMIIGVTVIDLSVKLVSFFYYLNFITYRPNVQLWFQLALYGASAAVLLFFPCGGYCGDVRSGRYKVVKRSLCVSLVFLTMLLVVYGILALLVAVTNPFVVVLTASIAGFFTLLLAPSFICFTSNIIQFGIDQLHDSPAKDQSLFIHWFVWTNYATTFVIQTVVLVGFPVGALRHGYSILVSLIAALFILAISIFTVFYCFVKRKMNWFLIEPGRINPYRLVFRVTDFARRHKLPLNRSAFTYCEDEWPSRLDLGKTKYGGPYLTEEVENVKSFYGILKVLFALGPVFFLEVATETTSPLFHPHHIVGYVFNSSRVFSAVLHANFLFSPLLILISIPLYLCFLQPYAIHCIPRMLSRMGIGLLLNVLIIISRLTLNIVALKPKDGSATSCMGCSYEPAFFLEAPFLVTNTILSALSSMLIYIAVIEFICAQSPNAMKGMLIGVFYAIKGIFELLGTIAVLPFMAWGEFDTNRGLGYFIVNLILGVIFFIVYVIVAGRYKYRVRDELSREREFAENYYGNPQRELNYDYSV